MTATFAVTLALAGFTVLGVILAALALRDARRTLDQSRGLLWSLREDVTEVARPALLLGEIVRAKRPGDELTMSRRMLDLLDEAARTVDVIARPDRRRPATSDLADHEPVPFVPVEHP